jgi:hypothetical protein
MRNSQIVGDQVVAIVLGASRWPKFEKLNLDPEKHDSNPFRNSKEFFVSYLISADGLALPEENILDLFDDGSSPYDLKKKIVSFITERKNEIGDLSDVIFYYVGHGDYFEKDQYYVATKFLDAADIKATRLDVEDITSIFLDFAGSSRHVLFLDSCYAAGAQSAFRQNVESAAKSISKLAEKYCPKLGTALFCAAGPRKYAKTVPGQEMTMFSGALSKALSKPITDHDFLFSLRELGLEMEQIIRDDFGSEGVLPEVHTPISDQGDIALAKIFPRFVSKPKVSIEAVLDQLKRVGDLVEKNSVDITKSNKGVKTLQARLEKIEKQLDVTSTEVHTLTVRLEELALNHPGSPDLNEQSRDFELHDPSTFIPEWEWLSEHQKRCVDEYIAARLPSMIFLLISGCPLFFGLYLRSIGVWHGPDPSLLEAQLQPVGLTLVLLSTIWLLVSFVAIAFSFRRKKALSDEKSAPIDHPIYRKAMRTSVVKIVGMPMIAHKLWQGNALLVVYLVMSLLAI